MNYEFRIVSLQQSSVINLHQQKEHMLMNPDYQRESGVWSLEKRQLLIDSLLNGFDIPKFYLHEFFPAKRIKGITYNYAIIDGRQRLETIWAFIEGQFPLDANFKWLRDPKVQIAGMTYPEIGKTHPQIKDFFNGITLDVVAIISKDIELIEEMFYRLNEAAPLNAAEKRNAFSGPVTPLIRKLASSSFFSSHIPYSNRRYRHYDLACKLIYFCREKGVTDTKRVYLDEFVRSTKDPKIAKKYYQEAHRISKRMAAVFRNKDILLRSPGMIAVYFLLIRERWAQQEFKRITRARLLKFEETRAKNRTKAESDETKADYELLEFDRLTQTPNDKYALEFRLKVLRDWLFK